MFSSQVYRGVLKGCQEDMPPDTLKTLSAPKKSGEVYLNPWGLMVYLHLCEVTFLMMTLSVMCCIPSHAPYQEQLFLKDVSYIISTKLNVSIVV